MCLVDVVTFSVYLLPLNNHAYVVGVVHKERRRLYSSGARQPAKLLSKLLLCYAHVLVLNYE